MVKGDLPGGAVVRTTHTQEMQEWAWFPGSGRLLAGYETLPPAFCREDSRQRADAARSVWSPKSRA